MQSCTLTDQELLELEARYCSYGDTVHYSDKPVIFEQCEGSWLFDTQGKPYLDMQMWYSAVNFGYRNKDIEEAHNRQMATLPQVASQYLHKREESILMSVGLRRLKTVSRWSGIIKKANHSCSPLWAGITDALWLRPKLQAASGTARDMDTLVTGLRLSPSRTASGAFMEKIGHRAITIA
jgi:hypothetical protein